MTSTSRQFVIGVLLASCQVASAAAQTASDPWYGGQKKPREIGPTVVFQNTFSIELPNNWQLAPGHAHTLLTTVEKKTPGAVMTLEHVVMNESLKADPEFMAEVKNLYLGQVQGSESSGKAFTAEVKQGRTGYFIIIQYLRPGLKGVENHVTQYLIPVGSIMYRLVCIAPSTEVANKYRHIFAWVAASFTPLPSPAK